MIAHSASFSRINTESKGCVFGITVARYLPLVVLGLMTLSCTSSASKVNPTDRKTSDSRYGIDETASKEENAKATKGNQKEKDTGPLFTSDTLIDALYKVETATFGAQTCTGSGRLKIHNKLRDDQPLVSLPEGQLDCGPLGTVDLRPILHSFSINPKDGNSEISNGFIRLKKTSTVSYSPARPILPAFLSTPKDKLASLLSLTKHEATDEEKQTTSEGVIEIRMISTGMEYRSPELRHTFRDVMNFNVICSGFEGTDKTLTNCFDLAEWHLALNPLAILRIKFIAPASIFVDSLKNNPDLGNSKIDTIIKGLPTSGGGGIIDDLVGADLEKTLKSTKVQIVLVLVDQKNLGTDEQKNDAQDSDDGVVVGR
jgi:hypothetical protein